MRTLCGTDIIEISRIQKSIEKSGENFIKLIYTPNEIKCCESKKAAKYYHYAGRFAAKEAIFKAVSKLLNEKYEISWKNAEILNDENGKPYINFIDTNLANNIEDIDISISHCKEYAVAVVVIICK